MDRSRQQLGVAGKFIAPTPVGRAKHGCGVIQTLVLRERKMKPAIALIAIATAYMLSGCGSIPIRETTTYPEIGSVETRGVGEKLISQGHLVPDIELHDAVMLGSNRLGPGKYDYEGENGKGIYFYFDNRNKLFYIRKSDGQMCDGRGKTCVRTTYSLGKTLSASSQSAFQQTLLYNGRIGNKVTFAYREFWDNLARPAFSNEVDYDLSETTVVGYQGARLEVINATNTEITYKVLSGFSRR